jgi:hypothetical protein
MRIAATNAANAASLEANINSGKYVTDNDRDADRRAEEERDAAVIVEKMKQVEPFGAIPETQH